MANDKSRGWKKFYTTTEFALLCGVSRFTIINWIKKGEIRAIRTVGKQYRIPLQEAMSLLETLHQGISHEEQKLEPPKEPTIEKKSFLYGFGYGFGKSMNGVKRFTSRKPPTKQERSG